MAFANLAALRAAQAAPTQQLDIIKVATTVAGVHWNSTWLKNGIPAAGATPGASSVPDRTTAGALGQTNKSAGALFAWLRRYHNGDMNVSGGKFMIADRLVHMGGLDGTLTTAQTVSTSALTRFTSGAGVMAGVEVFTGIGGTQQTLTASYTNQAGTAGRTSQPIPIGGGTLNGVGTFLPLSLQAGDSGVRAVATATLSVSTGTAGNFGIVLYKPLMTFSLMPGLSFWQDGDPIKTLGGYIPQIPDDACLWLLQYVGAAQTNVPNFELCFAES